MPHLHTSLFLTCLAIIVGNASAPAAGALPQQSAPVNFATGDVYLISNRLPMSFYGSSIGNGGVIRIAGNSPQLVVAMDNAREPGIAYDPYRDSLFFSGEIGGVEDLWQLDSSGAVSGWGFGVTPPKSITASGSGLVYLWGWQNGYGIQVIDRNNQVRDLLDSAGQPFDFVAAGGFVGGISPTEFLYHPRTHALYAARTVTSGGSARVGVMKLPLDSTGLVVVGPIDDAEIQVSTSSDVVGISLGPTPSILFGLFGFLPQQIFVTVDTNSGGQEARLLTVEPETLRFNIFATPGNYVGAATNGAGTFRTISNTAYVFDFWNGYIRVFSEGDDDEGRVLLGPGGMPPRYSPTRMISVQQRAWSFGFQ